MFDINSIPVAQFAVDSLSDASVEYGVVMGLILTLVVVFALFYWVIRSVARASLDHSSTDLDDDYADALWLDQQEARSRDPSDPEHYR